MTKITLKESCYINPKSLVSKKELLSIININESTLMRYLKNGSFPKPALETKQMGKGFRRFWQYQDILDWVESQK